MKRRSFLFVLALASLPVNAQQPAKIPVVGLLVTNVPVTDISHERLREGLKKYGYEDGKNIRLDIVTAAGQLDLVQGIADDFVRKGVDIILCTNELSIRAAMKATSTIPIVMIGFAADPVELGMVDSFNRPKGNVTGIHALPTSLDGKRLELIKEAVPHLSKVAVLWHPPFGEKALAEAKAAGKALKLQIVPIEVKGLEGLEAAFREVVIKKLRAVYVTFSPMFYLYRERVGDLALKSKLPMIAVYGSEGGGTLMAYGTDIWEAWKRAGYYVQRLLTGTKTSELPVEQVSTFKLHINMKVAKALSIKFPQSILVRAESVIE